MAARVTLTIAQGSLQGREYVFEQRARCTIGRACDCTIVLPNDLEHGDVSRRHCLLDIDPPLVRVADLGSRNGTFVNGDKIEPGELVMPELKDGDELRLASTVFQVNIAVTANIPESVFVPLYLV
jgi:pSer/pThr/pTyr-binding forkhead associated (FHA) protein